MCNWSATNWVRSRVCECVSQPTCRRLVLTAEGQQASVGDWGLTQVQHLEHSEVFRQEPQAGVSKLWDNMGS